MNSLLQLGVWHKVAGLIQSIEEALCPRLISEKILRIEYGLYGVVNRILMC